MLIDNKIVEHHVKENESVFGGNGSGKAGTATEKIPFIGKYWVKMVDLIPWDEFEKNIPNCFPVELETLQNHYAWR